MEPSEWLDPNKTVYHYNQCITEEDLRNFIDLLVDEADSLPEGFIAEKEKILVAARTASTLHNWIATGKQDSFRGLI